MPTLQTLVFAILGVIALFVFIFLIIRFIIIIIPIIEYQDIYRYGVRKRIVSKLGVNKNMYLNRRQGCNKKGNLELHLLVVSSRRPNTREKEAPNQGHSCRAGIRCFPMCGGDGELNAYHLQNFLDSTGHRFECACACPVFLKIKIQNHFQKRGSSRTVSNGEHVIGPCGERGGRWRRLYAFPYVGVMAIERFSMCRPVELERFSICG